MAESCTEMAPRYYTDQLGPLHRDDQGGLAWRLVERGPWQGTSPSRAAG
jgi:hypothetical protein